MSNERCFASRDRLLLKALGYSLRRNRRGSYMECYGDWVVVHDGLNAVVGSVDTEEDVRALLGRLQRQSATA